MVKALIFREPFVHQCHDRLPTGEDDRLNKQKLRRYCLKMANRKEWILEVVQKSKAKNQIELSQIAKSRILCVALMKANLRETSPSLFHVFSRPSTA